MATNNLTETHIALQLFAGYTEADIEIFQQFANPAAKPEPGFLVDFLGTRTRTSSLWKQARELDGQHLGIPVPGDFHAETVEWVGLLKAVRSAKSQYIAMELGAGFGPWIIAGAVAARLRGISNIRLYAVEADSQHYKSLCQHFRDNGFEPDEHRLFEAAVGVAGGAAEWPVMDEASAIEDWGCRPIHARTDYRGCQFQKTRAVKVIGMADLLVKEPYWDLIHIDVQGDEVEICRSAISELNARVRWLIAGTHSRKLDGDLLDLMFRAGWVLEHEKPARFAFQPYAASLEAMTTCDGTQVWRNPLFSYPGDRLSSFSQEITCRKHEVRVTPGSTFTLTINAKNTGKQSWFGHSEQGPVNAGYRWLDAESKILPIEGNRAKLTSPEVRPQESNDLELQVVAPSKAGSYLLWISMVQEGVAWFYDRGTRPLVLHVTVGNLS